MRNVAWFLVGFIATLLLLSACRPPPSSRYTTPQLQLQYENAAEVRVECVFPEHRDPMVNLVAALSRVRYGSAVAVGPKTAMTARHVIDCEMELKDGEVLYGTPMEIVLRLNNGTKAEFVVGKQGKDGSEDAALLEAVGVAVPFDHWASLADSDPIIGAEVCALTAYPWASRKCGHVSTYRVGEGWMGDGYVLYTLEGNSEGGNSGSGVYNSGGKLVAIHVARAGNTGGTGGGYVVSKWRSMVPPVITDGSN